MNKRPPHIILLMSDQQKASATGPWGNQWVDTPFWNRMSREGVRFEQCYAQSPICTPSRASLMTGTYPMVHQVYCHQNHAPDGLVQLPELLSKAGYHCIAAGHYESERSLDRGWHQAIDMLGTRELSEALREQYQAGSPEVGWSAGEHRLGPEEAHAALLNREVERLLDQVDTERTPLFLHVAYIEPHPPYFAPKGTLKPRRREQLPLPRRAESSCRPGWHEQALVNFNTAEATEGDLRRMLDAYYTLIEYADSQMERLFETLERRGILDEAWVIVASDHGDYAGEKGFFTKTESAYECLLHVPLVIRGPKGGWHPGEERSGLTELIDLFPTILGLAGVEPPAQNQGHDLVQWVNRSDATPLRDVTFSAMGEYHGYLKTTMPWGLPEAGRRRGLVTAARSLTHSYMDDPDHGPEAYDLRADPLELNNLGAHQPLPVEITALQEQLAKWRQENLALRHRLGILPGARNFDSPPDSLLTTPRKEG